MTARHSSCPLSQPLHPQTFIHHATAAATITAPTHALTRQQARAVGGGDEQHRVAAALVLAHLNLGAQPAARAQGRGVDVAHRGGAGHGVAPGQALTRLGVVGQHVLQDGQADLLQLGAPHNLRRAGGRGAGPGPGEVGSCLAEKHEHDAGQQSIRAQAVLASLTRIGQPPGPRLGPRPSPHDTCAPSRWCARP